MHKGNNPLRESTPSHEQRFDHGECTNARNLTTDDYYTSLTCEELIEEVEHLSDLIKAYVDALKSIPKSTRNPPVPQASQGLS